MEGNLTPSRHWPASEQPRVTAGEAQGSEARGCPGAWPGSLRWRRAGKRRRGSADGARVQVSPAVHLSGTAAAARVGSQRGPGPRGPPPPSPRTSRLRSLLSRPPPPVLSVVFQRGGVFATPSHSGDLGRRLRPSLREAGNERCARGPPAPSSRGQARHLPPRSGLSPVSVLWALLLRSLRGQLDAGSPDRDTGAAAGRIRPAPGRWYLTVPGGHDATATGPHAGAAGVSALAGRGRSPGGGGFSRGSLHPAGGLCTGRRWLMSHPGRPLRGCFTAWQQPRKGRPQTGTPRPRDRVSLTRWLRSEGKRWAPGPFCEQQDSTLSRSQ